MSDVASLPRRTPPLHPAQFNEKSFKIHEWHAFVSQGTPVEALTDPGFWAHVAHKLQPFSRILVDCEDMSWSARLKVTSASRLEAVVVIEEVLRAERPTAVATKEEDAYRIEFSGPSAKWRIRRNSDDMVIKDGLDSEEAARLELKGHVQAMRA